MSGGAVIQSVHARLGRAGFLLIMMIVRKKIALSHIQESERLLREAADELRGLAVAHQGSGRAG